MESLVRLFDALAGWVNSGSRGMMDKTVKDLASKYRSQISQGLNADGSPMASLRPATLKGPVRRESNPTIRETLGNTPLNATGRTSASIQGVKTGSDEWQIASQTDEGRKILSSNAASSHGGFPFYGDTQKVVRDPLVLEEKQLDFIEDQIVKDLERILLT